MKSFRVINRKIVVGDPCYEASSMMSCVFAARNGRWLAVTRVVNEGWGDRVSIVIVHHEAFDPIGKNYTERLEHFGVDSGQAGVFEAEKYSADHGSFYDTCCLATSSGGGFVPGGFVTSSGYGDGLYSARIYMRHGEAEAVEMVFIPESSKA